MKNGFFKDWAIPGRPLTQDSSQIAVPENETLDALCGHFRIFQLKDGHRYSTDDLVTAWYGALTCPSAERVLDLGSGIGSVGMLAAWKLPGAKLVTIEAQDESVRLARKSVALNDLESRYEIRHGDIRDKNMLGATETFDLILGSPPYFPLGSGVLSEHPQKIACRFETRGTVLDYAQVAAAHLTPGGVFACVFPVDPPAQAERVIEAARESGLTIFRRRDIVFKAGERPLIGVFALMRSTDLPERMRGLTLKEPDLVVRERDGKATHEYLVTKLAMGLPPTV